MACETKQAIDLLAILTPDVVLVDLRNAPAALVAFFEALELEGGHVLVLLVHGDAEGKALATVVERLMRSVALDPEGLTRTCAAVLAGPPVRTVPSRQRPPERVKANIRKLPLAPRATAKRR